MEDESIYAFGSLKEFLKRRGIIVGEAKPWEPIKGMDVGINEFKDGSLQFEDTGGISYTDEDGHKHVGFLYKRAYCLTEYGKPRKHYCKCETITSFIGQGTFQKEYRFAETDKVMVIDKDDNRKDKEVDNMPFCKNCLRRMRELRGAHVSPQDIEAEFRELSEKARQAATGPRREGDDEVDIFGYPRNWQEVSKEFREKKNFTCEKCGYHAESYYQQQFIHVHHRNGDKTNCRDSNLQCLCIRCHASVDDVHRHNFSRGAQKVLLDEFIKYEINK